MVHTSTPASNTTDRSIHLAHHAPVSMRVEFDYVSVTKRFNHYNITVLKSRQIEKKQNLRPLLDLTGPTEASSIW